MLTRISIAKNFELGRLGNSQSIAGTEISKYKPGLNDTFTRVSFQGSELKRIKKLINDPDKVQESVEALEGLNNADFEKAVGSMSYNRTHHFAITEQLIDELDEPEKISALEEAMDYVRGMMAVCKKLPPSFYPGVVNRDFFMMSNDTPSPIENKLEETSKRAHRKLVELSNKKD